MGGTRRALMESPAADFQREIVDQLQVAWSDDDRAVAVTGTFLPLGPATIGSKRPCGAAVVRIADGHADCLIDHANAKTDPVSSVSWSGANDQLLVQSGALEEFEYDSRRRSWRPIARRTHASVPALALAIQQDLNDPPVLTARDGHSGRSATIFDPNPQLKDIALGNVSVYTWKSRRGLSATGGLAKPPDFVPGHRYPLVIQTHGFSRDRFFRVAAAPRPPMQAERSRDGACWCCKFRNRTARMMAPGGRQRSAAPKSIWRLSINLLRRTWWDPRKSESRDIAAQGGS